MNIAQIIAHESYVPNSSTQYNDIALIRMARSIAFSINIKPVCLPFAAANMRNENYENILLTVAGFGRTSNAWNGKYTKWS